MAPVKRPAIERLLAKVDRAGPIPAARPELGPCWVWLGCRGKYGHGRFRDDDSRMVHTHRWLYEREVSPVPEGLELDHLCRNPPCCNPAHLEPVPHRINVLRGAGEAAINSKKEKCPEGHEYKFQESTRRRICPICKKINAWVRRQENPERQRELWRERRVKRRAARVAACPPGAPGQQESLALDLA